MHGDFFKALLNGPVLNPQSLPNAPTIDPLAVVEMPPDSMTISNAIWTLDDAAAATRFRGPCTANRDLGHRGEEFVLEFEQRRLQDVEHRPDLAKRWSGRPRARCDGGRLRCGLVQRRRLASRHRSKDYGTRKHFPFNVTANEVRCSEALPDEFQLYRVFNSDLPRGCISYPVQCRAPVISIPRSIEPLCGVTGLLVRLFVRERLRRSASPFLVPLALQPLLHALRAAACRLAFPRLLRRLRNEVDGAADAPPAIACLRAMLAAVDDEHALAVTRFLANARSRSFTSEGSDDARTSKRSSTAVATC